MTSFLVRAGAAADPVENLPPVPSNESLDATTASIKGIGSDFLAIKIGLTFYFSL